MQISFVLNLNYLLNDNRGFRDIILLAYMDIYLAMHFKHYYITANFAS